MSEARYFIDSNVWLYWLADDLRISAEERLRKRQLAAEVLQPEDLVVSTQVINEVCTNLIKKVGFSEDQILDTPRAFMRGILGSASPLRLDPLRYLAQRWVSPQAFTSCVPHSSCIAAKFVCV